MKCLVPLVLLLAACGQPRANANVRVTPEGVRVVPSLAGSLGGIGIRVTP